MTLKYQKYQQFYRQFQQLLKQLQSKAVGGVIPNAAFQNEALQIQQVFQQNAIPALAELDQDAVISAQFQAVQIEIHKQLKLLETDAVFLRAARQPATIQQRQQQIHQRLETLLRYCDAILSIPLPSDSSSPTP